MTDRARQTLRGGAIWFLPVLLLLAASCTSGEADRGSTTSTVAGAGGPTAGSSTTLLPETTTTTAAADPLAMLDQGLAASSSNYRFSSVVLVGEQILTSIAGVVDGTSVAAEITTGTGVLSYVRTPEGEWVTGADGEWAALEGEAPVSPPLAALADPAEVTLESGDSTRGVVTGRLGPAAGLAVGVPFSLTIEGGMVTEIRYQVESSAGPAQVVTTLSDVGSAGSVSAPEGV